MVDFDRIQELIASGFINITFHPDPDIDLAILNYTPEAQFSRHWTEETLVCRGLVIDSRFNIIARPFRKFFNYNEPEVKLPNEEFDVFEKMDGSLGICFFHPDLGWTIATRGSFNSDQAIYATNLLKTKYSTIALNTKVTYLFEIIYPENRIVVNYGNKEELILLAAIETNTGKEIFPIPSVGFPKVQYYPDLKTLSQVTGIQETNAEGFVIRFKNGYRVKVKFAEYVELHRIISGLSPKYIWELLSSNKDINNIVAKLPDEYYNWANKQIFKFNELYRNILEESLVEFENKPNTDVRKELAEYIKTCKYPQVLFAMLDNKDYIPIIWKLIKP